MLEKAATIKRFEYSSLDKELKAHSDLYGSKAILRIKIGL